MPKDFNYELHALLAPCQGRKFRVRSMILGKSRNREPWARWSSSVLELA
jgi:hypothetical protein